MTGLGSCLLLLVAMLVIAGVVLLTLPAPELQSEADLTWATLLHHERQTCKRCSVWGFLNRMHIFPMGMN